MGAGPSIDIENQERYVRQNYNKVASSSNGKYNKYQIEGKLRQEYHGGNRYGHNKDNYILEYDWNRMKKGIK